MSSFIGKWVPFARQAIYCETPIRFIKSNDFATLIIESGGRGYSIRKTLFGEKKLALKWHQSDDNQSVYCVEIEDGFTIIAGWIEDGKYFAKITTRSSIPGIEGTGIIFKKA